MSADFSLWKTRINVWKKDKLPFFPLFVRFILSFPSTNCLVYGYEVSSRVIPTINPGLLFSFVDFVKLKVHGYLFQVIFKNFFKFFVTCSSRVKNGERVSFTFLRTRNTRNRSIGASSNSVSNFPLASKHE